jgi:hypothetical protein
MNSSEPTHHPDFVQSTIWSNPKHRETLEKEIKQLANNLWNIDSLGHTKLLRRDSAKPGTELARIIVEN